MPRPTWDPTKPADSDQVSAFPTLHRGDKSTLKDILGTLGPFGTTTTTWRQVQIGDDTWLVQNLYFDGTNWNRDDTTKASVALGLRANGTVTVHKIAAGANPVGASLPAPVATLDAESLFDVLRASSVVVGTDPGGTEVLRASSARLNAPVLLGSVPQFTLSGDPISALQVATKQYVDARSYPRIIADVEITATLVTSVTVTLSESVTLRTPLKILGSCTFDPSYSSRVFMRVNNDSGSVYSSAWYGIGITSGSETNMTSAQVVPYATITSSVFWLQWWGGGVIHGYASGQWMIRGAGVGGNVHVFWQRTSSPVSFTFFVDTGGFTGRFVVWRLAP
jgi:hypothetical protein